MSLDASSDVTETSIIHLPTTVATNNTVMSSDDEEHLMSEGGGSAPDAIMQSTYLLVLFIALYSVVFLLGVSGNAVVVYVVIHNRAMQTITNIFIANLAVSDIIMCLLAVPFTPLSGLTQDWLFGDFLCHLVPMVMGVSVHVSTLTSTAVAVDRYFVIVHPFMPRMKVSVCMILIGVIWSIAISISLPLAIFQKVTWIDSESVHACHEDWPEGTARQFFTVVSLILQYIVPCSIISFCYGRVSASLRRRAKTRIGSSSRTRDQMEIQRKRKTNKMLIAMVSIFVCCWLPLNVIQLILEYHQEVFNWKYFLLTFFVTHVIAMSSTVYNPFLYAWMNENFRKEFKQVIPFMFSLTGGRASQRNGANVSQVRYATVDTQSTTSKQKTSHRNASTTADAQNVIYIPEKERVHLRLANCE